MDHGATLRRRFFIQQHPVTPRTQQIGLDCGTVAESWSHMTKQVWQGNEGECAKDVI